MVQLAKALGATVTGVASTAKLDTARALGADHATDYTERSIDAGDQRYDLIIDTGGVGRQLRAALLSPLAGQRLVALFSHETLEYIEPLAEYLAGGAVTPEVGQRFGLDGVRDAFAAMEAGTLIGKAAINDSD